MANTKISQLPLYSGSAADLRWFVMNNSGETITFKYSGFTSPLKSGSAIYTIVPTNADPSTNNSLYSGIFGGTGNVINSTSVVGENTILNGDNNLIKGDWNTILNGFNNSINDNAVEVNLIFGSAISVNYGLYNAFLTQNSSNNDCNWSAIIGGTGNNITGRPSYSGIFGGQSNTIGSANRSTIIGGSNNSIPSGDYSSIDGGQNNTINNAGYGFIGGGKYNTLSGGTNYSSIIGGLSNENYGNYSGIFNGTLNKINNPATEHSTIIGSYSSTTEGDYSHILGGLNNQINSGQAVIIAGSNNIIGPGGNDNSEMFGCRDSVISGGSVDTTFVNTLSSNSNGYDRVVMLGTSGRTATQDDTTYTENIKGFGTRYNLGGNNTIGGTDTYHFVVGKNNTLSNTAAILNTGAFVFGENNSVTGGRMNGAFGYGNSVTGWDAWAFGDNHNVGGYYSVAFGNNTNVASNQSFGFGYGSYVGAEGSFSFGNNNDITGGENQAILGGTNNTISSSGKNNSIIGGSGSTISGGTNVVMLGTGSRTNTTTNATFVENLVVFNYAGLNFADDTAAAAGGVVLGQVYHNNGALRIRIV